MGRFWETGDSSDGMVPFARRDVVTASALGAAAIAISAAGSGIASLWGDEAASILSAERSLPGLFALVQRVDAVHGAYYLGLHFWIGIFGASPFSVRFPSAVAVGVTVAGLVLLGRRLSGLRLGVIAGIVGAVLPRMTDVGSEARSYSSTAAIATWLTLVLVLILQQDSSARRRRGWIAYGIILGVGTILFIWIALIAAAHLVVLLIARSGRQGTFDRLPGWAAATGVAILAASPVLVFAFLERDQIAYLEQRQTYDVYSILITPWFESPGVAIICGVLVIAAGVLAVMGAIRADGRGRGLALLPLVWMLLPGMFLLLFSAFIAVYTPRYLSMCAPAAALLIAMAIDALAGARRRVEAVISLAMVIAIIAPVWLTQRGPNAKNDSDWAQISAAMAARAHPGDAVAFDDSTRPSRRTRLALRTYPSGFAGLLDPTLETPFRANDTWYDATYTLAQAEARGRLTGVTRIWLIEYAIDGKADTNGTATLEAAGFRLVDRIDQHRSAILEFVRS